MDHDRLKSDSKLLNLRQAAQKLDVSVETLQYLSDRYALVPVIDAKGELRYNEADLVSLLKENISRSISQQSGTSTISPSSNSLPPNTQKTSFFESLITTSASKFGAYDHGRSK